VATATAVLQIGAVPIFVDVDPRTYTADPAAVEAAITDRTRCLAPVDYGGMPCDYDALIALGRQRGIPVVADCAHAHGSQWRGTGVGALTEVGTFSFQAFKTLTTGEGGMVLTNDATLAERAYSYHHIGRVRGRSFYEHHVPASNLRMTEWQGAIGLAQLSRFADQTETRERNSRHLAAGLDRLHRDGMGVAPLHRDERVTRWGFYMWHFRFLPERWDGVTRDQFLRALRAEGVSCGTGHTQPLYKNPLFLDADRAFGRTGFPVRGHVYQEKPLDYAAIRCPETERIYTTEAVHLSHTLFLGPAAEMDAILEAISKLWTHRHDLRERPAAAG
jgi:dTDP-4-amino-4,6-dideoxygalactose transaminase